MADGRIRRYMLGGILRRALLEGFSTEAEGRIRTGGGAVHRAILPGLDGAVPGCAWGRLSLSCRLEPESLLTVRAFASDRASAVLENGSVQIDAFLLDPSVPPEKKEQLFRLSGGMERSGAQDILLEEQSGRYLWLWLEVSGGGVLENLRVYVPGDNFFPTLPRVYQTQGEFLRRYLSIFSTMYQEFQEEIDGVGRLFDVETAPPLLLPVFAGWLGLETDGALFSTDELREFLRAAPALLDGKGTRRALEMAVQLSVSAPVYLVEQNLLSPEQRGEARLYGGTPWDFTVLVLRPAEERLHRRLEFVIRQFKPVRSRCRTVFLADCRGLDAFSYLDINAAVPETGPGRLDSGAALTGMVCLQ